MEKSVKRQYRCVRYCEQRPPRWNHSNRSKVTYTVKGRKFNLHRLEKVLLALKNTAVAAVHMRVEDTKLVLTSEGFGFRIALNEVEK